MYFRLKRLQNFLYFTAIALVIKFIFFKSFKFRRIFIVLFRLLFAGFSAITSKIGLTRKSNQIENQTRKKTISNSFVLCNFFNLKHLRINKRQGVQKISLLLFKTNIFSIQINDKSQDINTSTLAISILYEFRTLTNSRNLRISRNHADSEHMNNSFQHLYISILGDILTPTRFKSKEDLRFLACI